MKKVQMTYIDTSTISNAKFLINHKASFGRNCSLDNIYLFKVNNKNTRERCEIYSKLTIKIPDRIVNFEHILHLFPVFLLLTLNK